MGTQAIVVLSADPLISNQILDFDLLRLEDYKLPESHEAVIADMAVIAECCD